jgi:hypothetical protein
MPLLRQYINGQRVHSLSVQASADDLNALKSLLEGKVEEWETKATGGTAIPMPDALNKMRFRIGKNVGGGDRKSCAITLHHVDPAKSDEDVRSAVIGKFNASWNVDENAEYCDPIYNRNDN